MQQLKIFNTCDILVTPWGANLTNNLLTDSKNTVLILYQEGLLDMHWWEAMKDLMNKLGKNQTIIRCKGVGNSDPRYQNMHVDIKVLESILN